MKITEVTTLREFVHLGSLLEEGTTFKVPSELDEDTALDWVKGKLADGVFEKEAKPIEQPKKGLACLRFRQ